MRRRAPCTLLVAALLALWCPEAFAIQGSNVCYQRWEINWSKVATYGPIYMCGGQPGNSTVFFKWAGTEDRGLFQIPTDACPVGGFGGYASDTYKELSPAAKQGEFAWELPETPGDYWVTSQAGSDCENGLKAQFRVMAASVKEDKAAENGSSSWRSGATAHALLASLAAAAALLALGL